MTYGLIALAAIFSILTAVLALANLELQEMLEEERRISAHLRKRLFQANNRAVTAAALRASNARTRLQAKENH